jgi:oligosaccharyltransferase complex subunit delta (ribophorin II)
MAILEADVRIHSFSEKDRVKTAVVLGHTETLKIALTTKEGSKAKRPHQAFLLLKEKSGLEAPYPLDIKSSGKATVDLVSPVLSLFCLLL